LGTYRLSQRNDYRACGKAVADSEMEYIFFRFENAMVVEKDPVKAVADLADICDYIPGPAYSSTNPWHDPYTLRDPLTRAFRNTAEQWQVKRSITYDHTTTAGASVYNYFTVEVEVISTAPSLPFAIDLRYGRHMNNSVTSIFQYNVFGQGDVDFSPAGSCRITGDIASNGSLYIGGDNIKRPGLPDSKLEIDASVFYITPAANSDTYTATDGSTQSLGVNTHDVYVTDPAHPSAPPTHIAGLDGVTWGTSEAAQVSQMPAPINLFGGLSPADILDKPFGQLLGSDASTLLYRSVISPPPEAVAAAAGNPVNTATAITAAGSNAEYPGATGSTGTALQVDGTTITDSSGVSALRAYNQAGLIITVNDDGSWAITPSAGGTSIATNSSQGNFANVISQTTMYDLREQKPVAITDINVGNLSTALTNSASSLTGGAFNGVMYVYLVNASSNSPAAVRLNNAAATPNYATGTGFTVATNGGLYVQGNYNTMTNSSVNDGQLVNADGSINQDVAPSVNPAVLMADAITVLSPHWDDSVANLVPPTDFTANRAEYTSGYTDGTVGEAYTGVPRVAAPTPTTPITINSPLPTPFTQTIAAGILTGNTTQNGAAYSGGSNNLVRFLEDWNYNGTGDTVNFYGSFGQLFESQIFNRKYYSPSDAGDGSFFFNYPGQRNYAYNSILKSKPPASAPNITAYSRGNVFTW
jgi:hypothetical protein